MLMELFSYAFVKHALIAGALAALVSGVLGFFVVLRRQSFAGHALSHVGFAGSAGAGFLHLSPLLGQLGATLLAAIGMGLLGERIEKSDMAIGIILAFFLGLGVLFLYFFQDFSGSALTLLFGDIFSVSGYQIELLLVSVFISMIFFIIFSRPLLFASLMPELAQSSGISLTRMSVFFFIWLALAVTAASMVVGLLLVFTLLIGPPAIALQWTRNIMSGIVLSVLIAECIVLLGIVLSLLTNFPSSFWMSALSAGLYLASVLIKRVEC